MIKKFLNIPDNKRLLENFLSLSILQIANYILPLITVPYLIRVLGFEYFGLITLAVVVIEYFILITNYGFELTATREISIHQKDINKISEIFSSVMVIKFLLLIFSFFILTFIVFTFEKFHKDWILYYLTFGIVVGNILFPSWFFQGIENMKYITVLNFISKLSFVLLIFLFVRNADDYYLVPLLNSLGYIFAGLLSLAIITKKFKVKFILPEFKVIKQYFLDGWHIFLSRIYVNLYTNTNVLILGILTNNVQVGYFSVVQKIVLAVGKMLEPVNQVLFPYLSKLYKNNTDLFFSKISRLTKLFLFGSISLFIFSFFLKDFIVHLVTGEINKEVSGLLGIFLLRIITYPLAPLFSNVLIIMKKNKEYLKIMNFTVAINFLLVPVSIYFWEVEGLVISFIFVIFIHVFLLFLEVRKISQNKV